MLAVPAVEEGDAGEEADADDRVEGHEPSGGKLGAHEGEVELLVAPDQVGVEDLVGGDDADGHHGNEQEEGDEGRPVAGLHPGGLDMALMLRLEMLLGQIFLAREIDGEDRKRTRLNSS